MPGCQRRLYRHGTELYFALRVAEHYAHIRLVRAFLQHIHPYHVRAQTVPLCYHLQRVPPWGQASCSYAERVSRRARLLHRLRQRCLAAVHIQRHSSQPAASQCERYAYRLAVGISAPLQSRAHVVVRGQRHAHHRHARISLLRLLFAIVSHANRLHIHVHLARRLHVLRQIHIIAALCHASCLLLPKRRRAHLHAYRHRRLHAVALVLRVHVVVCPGQHSVATLLYQFRAHLRCHQYAARRRRAATAACR